MVIELKSKAGSYQYGKTEDIQRVIGDVNFTFYRNAAAKFGFYIDKSAPWCLIANVSSIEMQNNWVITQRPTPGQIQAGKAQNLSDEEIVKQYTTIISDKGLIWKPGDASNLFDLYYQRTEAIDATEFPKMLLQFYNMFVKEYPVVKIEVPRSLERISSCGPKRVEFTREPVENADMETRKAGLKMYFLCRMAEDKRIQNYKSLQSQNDVFTPKDERMTLSCQSFETCGVKKSDQKKYNRYVPEKFEF